MFITDATNLPRVMACNGSRLMAASLPPDIDYAKRDEGNAADWLAIQCFNAVPVVEGAKAPNGFIITAEMMDFVWQYLNALNMGAVQVKTTFGTDRWQVNARADHIVWESQPHNNLTTLVVDDLKYGFRIVEPELNWTLIAHAIGECINRNSAPDIIKLRIHQPRAFHPEGICRTWELSYAELMTYYEVINATLSNPNDMLNTGPQCHYCHAEPTCPARRLSSYNAIEASTLAFNDQLPMDALNYELDLLEAAEAIVKDRREAISELMLYRMKGGEVNTERAVEQKRGQTRFKTGMDGAFLTAASGIDCTKPGTITPAEFLRRGGSQKVYDQLTERPITGTKLVRVDSDARARRLLNK